MAQEDDRRMWHVALWGHRARAEFEKVRPDRLDRDLLPTWISLLKDSESEARIMRGMLEAVAEGDRPCEVCGTLMGGRADRRYCGATCRQRARRTRLSH